MNASKSFDYRRENANRQAKRLAKRIDVPLTIAKEILAKGPYRCACWADLCRRIETGSQQDHVVLLGSLPDSNTAKLYFSSNIQQLARSFSQQILTNTNLAGVYEILRTVFGITGDPVDLADIAPAVGVSTWAPAGIGPDPSAVVYAFTVVNGVTIKLIGTRVYLPAFFRFGPDVKSPPNYAEPDGEALKIIWSNPRAWYEAAHSYLSAEEDDEKIELELPVDLLDEAMLRHHRWFLSALEIQREASVYGCDDDHFIPLILRTGCYLIFGVPCHNVPNSISVESSSVPMDISQENDSKVVLINNEPTCLEWIRVDPKNRMHDGQYLEYFEILRNGVLSHAESDLNVYSCAGWNGSVFFFRPASQFDIDQLLKVRFIPEPDREVFTLKSDHPSVALTILDKVARRDLVTYAPAGRSVSYAIELDVSAHKTLQGLSLSLDILGQSRHGFYNLIARSVVSERLGRKTLLLLIEPRLIALIDLVGKKTLKEALQFGLILRLPAGFSETLEKEPKRCNDLTNASQDQIDRFEAPIFKNRDASFFDLFRYLKVTKNKRDNY